MKEFRLHDERIAALIENMFRAGIKNPDQFLRDKQLRVYGYLKGAFPRGCLPTDIDGEIEINGHFLRLEFKHESVLAEGRIPKGQMKLFEALRSTNKFTILIVGHDDSGEPTCAQMFYVDDDGQPAFTDYKACPRDKIKKICARWSQRVEPGFEPKL